MGVPESAAGGEETFWAVQRFFEATARECPLVIVFDDVHSGEPTFLDLIEHIADRSRDSPILLLCMARPDLLELRPSWAGGKPNAATVSLEPLTVEQASVLVANLLGSAEAPAELANAIVDKAEGNPLFVEETLAMLIDEGRVIREDQGWRATGDVSAVTVPPSIHALLAARLDRLALGERTVLEAAAVIGKDFLTGAARALVPENGRSRVSSDLMALAGTDLIRPERTTLPGEDAFRFRHLLIRDAAYDAIAKTRRAQMHEAFADWLERVGGEAVIEQEEIVGYHLQQAHAYRTQLAPADERSDEIGRRAAARLASAGRRASSRGDFPAAANLLRHALTVDPPAGPERAATLFHLGMALAEVDDAGAAFSAFDEAVRLAAVSGDPALEWRARIARSDVQAEADPHSLSSRAFREELGKAISGFEELEDEAGLATAWTKLASLEFQPCRYDRVERAARRAAMHARECQDGRLLVESLRFLLASQIYGSATPEAGYRVLDEVREDLSRSRHVEAAALAVRGWFEGMEGSFDEARHHLTLAIEIAESLGTHVMVAAYGAFLGDVETLAGDATAAERALRRSYDLLHETGHDGYKSTVAATLAHVLCTLRRFDEAGEFAAIARSAAADDDLASQAFGRSAQAMVLAEHGGFDDAEQLAREAVEILEVAEWPGGQGDVRMDLAQVLRMAGHHEDAGRAAREALELYERKGNRPSSDASRVFLRELGAAAF